MFCVCVCGQRLRRHLSDQAFSSVVSLGGLLAGLASLRWLALSLGSPKSRIYGHVYQT